MDAFLVRPIPAEAPEELVALPENRTGRNTMQMMSQSGVSAFHTATRVWEIGVQMALGAGPATVLRSVLYRALGLAGKGAVLGLLGVLTTAGLVRRFVLGVEVGDPRVAVGVPLLLVAVAPLAASVPARRAASGGAGGRAEERMMQATIGLAP